MSTTGTSKSPHPFSFVYQTVSREVPDPWYGSLKLRITNSPKRRAASRFSDEKESLARNAVLDLAQARMDALKEAKEQLRTKHGEAVDDMTPTQISELSPTYNEKMSRHLAKLQRIQDAVTVGLADKVCAWSGTWLDPETQEPVDMSTVECSAENVYRFLLDPNPSESSEVAAVPLYMRDGNFLAHDDPVVENVLSRKDEITASTEMGIQEKRDAYDALLQEHGIQRSPYGGKTLAVAFKELIAETLGDMMTKNEERLGFLSQGFRTSPTGKHSKAKQPKKSKKAVRSHAAQGSCGVQSVTKPKATTRDPSATTKSDSVNAET